MRRFVESVPQIMPMTLSVPPSTASHSTFSPNSQDQPCHQCTSLGFPSHRVPRALIGSEELSVPRSYTHGCDRMKYWIERRDFNMADRTLGYCCCLFCSSGSDRDRDRVTTMAAAMGKGVTWEVDTSWNCTHLYVLSPNHHHYLCCSHSHLLGGICSRCRLNFPTPSCYGLCG